MFKVQVAWILTNELRYVNHLCVVVFIYMQCKRIGLKSATSYIYNGQSKNLYKPLRTGHEVTRWCIVMYEVKLFHIFHNCWEVRFNTSNT